MKQVSLLLFASAFVYLISSCTSDSTNSESGWSTTLGDISISSNDSLRIGLNRMELQGLSKISDLQIASDNGEIAVDYRNSVLWLAISEGTEVKFGYKGEFLRLPIAEREKISVMNDTVWIAGYLPEKAVYGRQPLVTQIFRKSNNTWGKSYEDLDFIPWMNMGNGYGHGSQFNVSPVLVDTLGGRLYRGIVSFSMPGMWDLRFITFNDTLETKVSVVLK